MIALLSIVLVVLIAVFAYLMINRSAPIEAGLDALKNGKYDKAISDFEIAIKEEKSVDEAYLGLGLSYYEKKDYEKTVAYLKQALDNGIEETPIIYNILGVSSKNLGDVDGAVTYYDSGLNISGDYADIQNEMLLNMTEIYEEKQDYENARNYLARYVELNPQDVDAQKELNFLQTR